MCDYRLGEAGQGLNVGARLNRSTVNYPKMMWTYSSFYLLGCYQSSPRSQALTQSGLGVRNVVEVRRQKRSWAEVAEYPVQSFFEVALPQTLSATSIHDH